MLPILHVGPLAIQLPGLILLLGLWIGLMLAERHSVRTGVEPGILYNLVFVGLIAGIIGARLGYVLRYPGIFIDTPLSLVSLNPGLLDSWAGIAAGGISALIYAQRKGLALWSTLDALTPVLGVLSISIGLSHLASGAAFGEPTALPWGIELWGTRRHPSQIYQILASTTILVVLWPGNNSLRRWPSGLYFLTYAALSALAILFLEGFRGDSRTLLSGIRTTQVIAWFILGFCLWRIRKLISTNSFDSS